MDTTSLRWIGDVGVELALAGAGEELETVDVDLGDGVLDGVAVLPGAGAEFAFDEEARAFADVFLGNLGVSVPHNQAVPLGALGYLGAVAAAARGFGGGQGEFGHGTALDVAYLRVTADVAH